MLYLHGFMNFHSYFRNLNVPGILISGHGVYDSSAVCKNIIVFQGKRCLKKSRVPLHCIFSLGQINRRCIVKCVDTSVFACTSPYILSPELCVNMESTKILTVVGAVRFTL